ncbi:hypothetical protein GCM10020254_02960 [Streptomyces goshikiensis]
MAALDVDAAVGGALGAEALPLELGDPFVEQGVHAPVGLLVLGGRGSRVRLTAAGTPPASTPAGRSRLTTLPAAMMVSAPMVTPGSTVAW